jgi:hypothetical protein
MPMLNAQQTQLEVFLPVGCWRKDQIPALTDSLPVVGFYPMTLKLLLYSFACLAQ